MAWDWPIVSYLFGGVGAGVTDWWKTYQWVFWLILVLICVIVAVWCYIKLRGA